MSHAERDDEHADTEEVIEKADGALQNAEFADVLLLLRVCIPTRFCTQPSTP